MLLIHWNCPLHVLFRQICSLGNTKQAFMIHLQNKISTPEVLFSSWKGHDLQPKPHSHKSSNPQATDCRWSLVYAIRQLIICHRKSSSSAYSSFIYISHCMCFQMYLLIWENNARCHYPFAKHNQHLGSIFFSSGRSMNYSQLLILINLASLTLPIIGSGICLVRKTCI